MGDPQATVLKHVRTRLRDEFGFPNSEIHAQAYLASAGRAMGTHRGDEPAPTNNVAGEQVSTPQPSDKTPGPAARGSWRARAAGRLLAPLRSALILSGVLQAVITVVQLAPFVLLVELARLLVAGAPASRLGDVGIAAVALLGTGTVLGAALTLWLHVVDARFAADLRSRLLRKLSRLPLGWFTARGSGSIKQLLQDDTLSLHYLVTHAIPDAVTAIIAPVAVLVYLFAVDWRVALVLFLPVLVYLALTSSAIMIPVGPTHPAITAMGREDERRGRRLPGGPAGDPRLRRCGRIQLPAPPGRVRRSAPGVAAPTGRQEDAHGPGHPALDLPVADTSRSRAPC